MMAYSTLSWNLEHATGTLPDHSMGPSTPRPISFIFIEALDKVTYLLVIVGTKHHITHTFLYDEVPGIQSVLRRAVTRAAAAYFIVRNTDKPLSITIEEQNMIGDFVDKSDVIGIDFMALEHT